jgi:hypothetical protein
MNKDARAAFMIAARQRLVAFALPEGPIKWSPAVFRVRARR